jgi:hypothetical protein
MLTDEQIAGKVQNAFAPLRCVVEIQDDRKLTLKVFNGKDKPILRLRTFALKDGSDENQLAHILRLARSRIRAKGLILK